MSEPVKKRFLFEINLPSLERSRLTSIHRVHVIGYLGNSSASLAIPS
jgi:hypothetical protein